jgi:hypothetical protein
MEPLVHLHISSWVLPRDARTPNSRRLQRLELVEIGSIGVALEYEETMRP